MTSAATPRTMPIIELRGRVVLLGITLTGPSTCALDLEHSVTIGDAYYSIRDLDDSQPPHDLARFHGRQNVVRIDDFPLGRPQATLQLYHDSTCAVFSLHSR
jgi:hypothetical protein